MLWREGKSLTIIQIMYHTNAFKYRDIIFLSYWLSVSVICLSTIDPNVRVSQRPSSLSSSSTSTHRIPTNSSKSSTSHPVPTSLLTGECLNLNHISGYVKVIDSLIYNCVSLPGSPVFITVSVILAVLLVLLIAFFTGIFWRSNTSQKSHTRHTAHTSIKFLIKFSYVELI